MPVEGDYCTVYAKLLNNTRQKPENGLLLYQYLLRFRKVSCSCHIGFYLLFSSPSCNP